MKTKDVMSSEYIECQDYMLVIIKILREKNIDETDIHQSMFYALLWVLEKKVDENPFNQKALRDELCQLYAYRKIMNRRMNALIDACVRQGDTGAEKLRQP